MKKLLIITFLLLGSFFSVNALSLETDQTSNIEDYRSSDKGNTFLNFVVGSKNDSFITPDNVTITYDYSMEFPSISEDFYIVVNNYFENSTIELIYRGDLTKDPTLYIQEVTLNEQGEYYFKFKNDEPDEIGKIYINVVAPTHIINIEYSEEKPKGFNSIISPMVTLFSEIIEINILFWQIAFYIIIFALAVLMIWLLFWGANKINEKSKELNKRRS